MRGVVPVEIRRSVELWIGCVVGALDEPAYRAKIEAAGFEDVEIEPWRVYVAGRPWAGGYATVADRDPSSAARRSTVRPDGVR